MEEASRFLAGWWVPFRNERFRVEPRDPEDAHRPLPPGVDLGALFAETESRKVAHDFTIRFGNRFWQIPKGEAEGVGPGAEVVVERRLGGDIRLSRPAVSGGRVPGLGATTGGPEGASREAVEGEVEAAEATARTIPGGETSPRALGRPRDAEAAVETGTRCRHLTSRMCSRDCAAMRRPFNGGSDGPSGSRSDGRRGRHAVPGRLRGGPGDRRPGRHTRGHRDPRPLCRLRDPPARQRDLAVRRRDG